VIEVNFELEGVEKVKRKKTVSKTIRFYQQALDGSRRSKNPPRCSRRVGLCRCTKQHNKAASGRPYLSTVGLTNVVT
jgi:hypothetical protein